MDNQSLGKAILNYCSNLGYRIRAYNIIYIEGVDPVEDNFKLNGDAFDYWNDTRNVVRDDGVILLSAVATTEPGKYYTYTPMNPNGAARIAFGQYKDCWEFGTHGISYPHEALVQCGEIKVYRDFNQDGLRTGDLIYTDAQGVNQHTTSNAPDTIGLWGAGCLVGRYESTHKKFMQLMRDSGGVLFDTTILDGTTLHENKIFG